ncbi:MAG: hypothetical protein J1F17_07545 [Oscillospiraceae bacterium]|nr:hypothetical protein [Oscillospiraceae bacterium]
MGIISNIKNRYRVNKNVLWVINTILIFLTMAVCIFAALYSLISFQSEEKYVFSGIITLTVAVNIIAFVCNRKYLNTPVSVVAVAATALSVYMMIIYFDSMYWAAILSSVSLIIYIITVIMEYRTARSEKSLVKIAKVKPDFDFRPEDVIEEYRLSLKLIEEKYNMGEKDRDAFEKEKEGLLSDTHHIMRKFIDSNNVSLIFKLETLYQAKKECIIAEESYLLWKNYLLKDNTTAVETKAEIENLYKNGGISQEDYIHHQELFMNEF